MQGTVFDSDGHVLEPLSAWSGLPDDQRPQVHRDAVGLDHVTVGGQEILTVSLGLLGTPGSKMSDLAHSTTLEEAQPGGFDPVLRLADLDTEGIDIAVLYPSVGLNFWAVTDAAAAVALARAYNDWLASYCAAAPDRLFGAAMVPMQDPVAAAEELRRAHVELGFPAAFVRPNPINGKVVADPSHEPVWQTAEELGVVIGIHEGSSVAIDTLGLSRAPFNPLVHHAMSHPFEMMMTCAQLMAFGVMERHPTLKFAFLESGGSWLPFWMWRLEEQLHGFGDWCPEMKLEPAEYFARQCWISFEIDEDPLPALVPFVGEDRIIWGSDYPHHDSTFPGAVDRLRRTIAPLSAEVQAKILGANASALYGVG